MTTFTYRRSGGSGETPLNRGMTRPSDVAIKAAVREAKEYWISRGVEFKSVAEAQRDNYTHFTHDDKLRAMLVTSRAAVRLAEQYPDAEIGLEAYSGPSGVALPGRGDEKYSYQIILFGRSGPSNQVMLSGVEPDSSWHHDATDEDRAAWTRDWRVPVTTDIAPDHIISRPPSVPSVPATTPPTTIPKLHIDTVTDQQLRRWVGSIATTLWDGPGGIRENRTDNSIFTAMYDSPIYSRADREKMLAAYPYSHFAMGPFIQGGYHAYWPKTDFRSQPNVFLDRMQEVWDSGKVPAMFALPDTGDYADGRTIDRAAVERDLTPLYSGERWQRLCKVVVLAWEPEYHFDDVKWGLQWLARVFPHAKRYLHLFSEMDAPGYGVNDKASAWREVAPYIHGVLPQYTYTFLGELPDPTRTPEQQVLAHAAQWVRRFRDGESGWPTRGADNQPIDVVFYEYGSYALFHGGPGRFGTFAAASRAAIEMGRQLMTVDGLAGVGDGCPTIPATQVSPSSSLSESVSASPSASPSAAPPSPSRSWWDQLLRALRKLFR